MAKTTKEAVIKVQCTVCGRKRNVTVEEAKAVMILDNGSFCPVCQGPEIRLPQK